MKKILAGIAVSVVLSMTACIFPLHKKSANWDYVITQNTNIHSLDSLRMFWVMDSINLQFTKMEKDSAGKLFKVEGTVDITSHGHKVSATFSQDSIPWKPLEIRLNNSPMVYVGIKK